MIISSRAFSQRHLLNAIAVARETTNQAPAEPALEESSPTPAGPTTGDTASADSDEPPKFAAPAAKSALDAEELKIPAWLEPLARNAAAPNSTQDLIEREKGESKAFRLKNFVDVCRTLTVLCAVELGRDA